MIEAGGEEHLDHEPADVFDFVADPTTEPLWNPDLLSIADATPGPVRVGSTRHGEYKHIGRVESVVTDVERPDRLAFRARARHAEVTLVFRFLPADGGGTRLVVGGRLSLRGPLRLVEPGLRATVAGQYAERARAIKRAMDGGERG